MSTGPILPKNTLLLLAIGTFFLFLLIFRLDYLPLKFEEPRRALVATEMLISGNFWAPTINGEFYYNKPPVFNWMVAGLFQIFGFHNWVERLPTLLSIIGIALTNFLFFRKRIGNQVAGLSSTFYLVSGHMLFYFSFQGEIDITYSFVVLLQVLSIFYYFEEGKWTQLFMVSYTLMAIGFLMKGLPSIAFQGLTLLGAFIWFKEFKKLFSPAHLLGGAVAMLLLFGYFQAYSQYNDPELLIAKLTIESASRTSEGGPIGNYLLQLLKFPAMLVSIMLPGFLIIVLSTRIAWKELLRNRWITYCIVFILFNIPLYWISPGTRDRYVYMFLPFLYNVVLFVSLQTELKKPKRLQIAYYGVTGFLCLALVVIPFFSDQIGFLWSAVTVMLLMASIVLVQKKHVHPIFGFALLMLCLRFYYNQVVFPIRGLSPDNIAATLHAEKIIELTGEEPLFFHGSSEMLTLKIPFRKSVEIREIERLPYQFSYYYSSSTKKIIPWVDEKPSGSYYLTATENITGIPALYSFEMEGRSFSLVKSLD